LSAVRAARALGVVVSVTDADVATGLELLRRCAVAAADEVLKSIAGGSLDDDARPLVLDSAGRGDRRPWSVALASRGAGAGGDECAGDWFGLQVRWCVSQ